MSKPTTIRPVPSTVVDLPGGKDRRIRGRRLDVRFMVIATMEGRPVQGFIECQNLSWSGMMLLTNFPLKIKDRLGLEFRLPDSDVPVTVRARVVYTIDGAVPEDGTQVGVVFEQLDINVQRMISGFVLERLSHH